MEQTNIMDNLKKVSNRLSEEAFLTNKGLSNEVGIHVFCYDPKEEMAVRHFTEKLMFDQSLNCHLIEYNLYKVFLSICDDRHLTNRCAGVEEKKGKKFLLDQLLGDTRKEGPAGVKAFIKKMEYEPHQPGDVILITGVGEAFPFIRLHSLLEAMQAPFFDVPVLAMYPGTFDGRYVKLFDKLEPNPYYRAFNVI